MAVYIVKLNSFFKRPYLMFFKIQLTFEDLKLFSVKEQSKTAVKRFLLHQTFCRQTRKGHKMWQYFATTVNMLLNTLLKTVAFIGFETAYLWQDL